MRAKRPDLRTYVASMTMLGARNEKTVCSARRSEVLPGRRRMPCWAYHKSILFHGIPITVFALLKSAKNHKNAPPGGNGKTIAAGGADQIQARLVRRVAVLLGRRVAIGDFIPHRIEHGERRRQGKTQYPGEIPHNYFLSSILSRRDRCRRQSLCRQPYPTALYTPTSCTPR